jgi:hypothetical protein
MTNVFNHKIARRLTICLWGLLVCQGADAKVLRSAYFDKTRDLSELRELFRGRPEFVFSKDRKSVVEVVANPDGSGHVLRFAIAPQQERAEVRAGRDAIGTERWYGWSLHLPADYRPVEGKSDILFQWHRGGGAPRWARGHPMCFMINDDGNFQFIWTYQKNPKDTGSRIDESKDLAVNYVGDRGKWVHWALHAKWSVRSDGYLCVYRNGRPIWENHGPNWLNWGAGPMVKCGIYTGNPGWTGNNPTVVYHDNIVVGDHDSNLHEVCPALAGTATNSRNRSMQKLKIGPNRRFLVKEDGSAFVWIGATMWKWKALSWEQIKRIIDDHSSGKYSVLQIIAYPDRYETVDRMVEYAQNRNLYIALLTGWYRDVERGTESSLYKRGFTLGSRYKDKNNIIWLTAGEAGGHHRRRKIDDKKIDALVKGIRDGDTGDKLLTIHADYKRGTSIDNDTQIVDFDNWQTSQWPAPTDLPRNDPRMWTVWEAIEYDYNRTPVKPTLDAEAWYEQNKDHPGATPFAIRRRAYYTILAGGFGHTYGAGGIWDGLLKPKGKSGNWETALTYKGYIQIGYLSEFLHSLGDDFLKLRPDQSIIESGNSYSYDKHIQASVAADGSFALIYSASDSIYELDLTRLEFDTIPARWYKPAENKYRNDPNSPYKNSNSNQYFDPPGDIGAGNDWVLVLGNIFSNNQGIKSETNLR